MGLLSGQAWLMSLSPTNGRTSTAMAGWSKVPRPSDMVCQICAELVVTTGSRLLPEDRHLLSLWKVPVTVPVTTDLMIHGEEQSLARIANCTVRPE